jgi:ribosomal protein S6--L-glutamate ligase
MKLAVLAANRGWHVREIERAVQRCGGEAVWADFRSLRSEVEGSSTRIVARADGELCDLNEVDAVLVRTMPGGSLEQVVYRMDALHALQAAGVPVVNPPRALETAIDKFLSLSRLAAAGLPVPRTIACESTTGALDAFAALGGVAVSKPLFGSEGKGLLLLRTWEDARTHFAQLEASGRAVYLQEFIRHPGWDLRVLVLWGEACAWMRRVAAGSWITNIACGGRGERVDLSGEARQLAERSAEAVGALVAGVDLLPDRAGELRVLEVNAVPGWRALQGVWAEDLAVEVVSRVVRPLATSRGGAALS